MQYVQYVLTAIPVIAAIVFFYRVVLPTAQPDFALKSRLDAEQLTQGIAGLAYEARTCESRGAGLSVRLIKRQLDKAYRRIAEKAEAGAECYGFEYWLYDNHYKLAEILSGVKREVRKFDFLPHAQGLPRVYKFAEFLIKSSDGYLDYDTLGRAIDVYQTETPLLYAEITALQAASAYALLEFLSIFCAKGNRIGALQKKAARDAQRGRADLPYLRYNAYAEALYRLSGDKARRRIADLCVHNGTDIAARSDAFYATIARYDGQVETAVKTIHRLSEIFTDKNVIALSPVFRIFSDEPDILFGTLTQPTQYLYLSRVYAAAKKEKLSEPEFARRAAASARQNKRDISFELLPEARSKSGMYLYIAVYAAVTAALCALVWFFSPDLKIAGALVSLPPAFFVTGILFGTVLGKYVKRRVLPGVELCKTDNSAATLIAVPRLIADEAEIEDAFLHIETIAAANPELLFSYGLLLDFPAAETEQIPRDTAFWDAINARFERSVYRSRLAVLVRKRQKTAEGKFQGWEKKRGALIALNERILKGESDAFRYVRGDIGKIKYVVTLDCDTLINACAQLVELMEHPYNRTKNVISVRMNTRPSGNPSVFSELFCGAVGLSNYVSYTASGENDLFGCGNYTGKGIYRVEAFQHAVADAFYDGRLLSHDYVEGAYAGCADSAVTALDEFPLSFNRFFIRQLRWIKGDWQLLPFLFPKTRARDGVRGKNPVSPIGKWHIFSNLIASLVPIASVALVVLSLFCAFPYVLLTAAFAPYAVPILVSVRASVLHARPDFIAEFFRRLFLAAVMPVIAVYTLGAVLLTLWRLLRGKKLLEWKTFAHAKGGVSFSFGILTAFALAAAAYFLKLSVIYYGIAALYFFGFALNLLYSGQRKEKPYTDPAFRETVFGEFKRAYRYFTDAHEAALNYLPCDHIAGGGRRAERTSPTNIGFALCAHISAYEAGVISLEKMTEYCVDIITTVEKMEKWNGNLYNWTDIRSLKTLTPRYISAVDSGNFLIALTLLSLYAEGDLKKRVEKLIEETKIERLYDPERGLLYIGYNESEGEFDAGHYDLFAGEALATYLVAAGHGKIGKESVDRLARQALAYRGKPVTASWTGGMFEYLMTPLFFTARRGTAFFDASRNAVRAQIAYAKGAKLKAWGISESQYTLKDEDGNYQYKAFGVPGIALSNMTCPSVVAPYASFLALPFAPRAVRENLARLDSLGMRGAYGFYESADLATGEVIPTFMAHHLGMSLAGMCNFLCGNALTEKMREHPAVRAAELLLSGGEKSSARKKREDCMPLPKSAYPPETVSQGRESIPKLGLLSCGSYALMSDARGKGYALYDGTPVTRYITRNDGPELFAEADGEKCNLLSGKFTVAFDSVRYECEHGTFGAFVRVSALPSGRGEVREVRLINRLNRPLCVTVTSKIEPVLRDRAGDIAHRAYSDLFMETACDELTGGVTMWRKNGNNVLYVTHYTVSEHKTVYNTDRRAYAGRVGGQCAVEPYPIDPVISGVTELWLAPKAKAEFAVYTVCASDAEELRKEVACTREPGSRVRDKGTYSAVMRRHGLSPALNRLAAKLLFAGTGSIRDKAITQYADATKPILCLKVNNERGLPRLKTELAELKALYRFGIIFNLYILYNERYGYFLHINEAINEILDDLSFHKAINAGSSIRVLNASEHKEAARIIEANAIRPEEIISVPIAARPRKKAQTYPPAGAAMPETVRKLPYGGFNREYGFVMDLSAADTPRPWSNVIASERIGTVVTERGGGYTFCANAHGQKLTHWTNDTVCDPVSEFVALHENGNIWSVTKLPAPTKSAYYVTHSLGYSEFLNNYNGILANQRVYIARDTAVKFYDLKLENCTDDPRTIEGLFAIKPVLGDFASYTMSALRADKIGNCVRIQNTLNGLTAYLHCSETIAKFSPFHEAFTDADGNIAPLDVTVAGSDFFPSVSAKISLPPRGTGRIIFALGTEPAVDFDTCDSVLARATNYYANLADVKLEGYSDEAILSRWLPYQTLSSRFFARAGLYQAGGAVGFRDQLQDCLALLHVDKALVRKHIITCAGRQFEKGDVLHWWHPPNIGVRTKISDDRLWLPYVTAEYIAFTGDRSILAERAPFLKNRAIPVGAKDLYAAFESTERTGTVLEHCLRALRVSLDCGDNGLCKMGTGDWNDAMDKIGEKGRGTSVFTTMLLYAAIHKFLPYVKDTKLRDSFLDIAEDLKKAINAAFDGEWFIRAVTDDGKIIGSAACAACKIDLLTQSWAVLSGAGEESKCGLALQSALSRLVDFDHGIVRLLTPPFQAQKEIGYIADYPPGVRENGGQYTHAAVWFVMSLLKSGQTDTAWRIFRMLSPLSHVDTPEKVLRYGNEPYVLSADVYVGERAGQAGWSWYTGAAAWYYKCLVEEFLGIRIRGNRLSVAPNLPESVGGWDISLRFNGNQYAITVDNTAKKGDWRLKIGNILYNGNDIELSKILSGKKITVLRAT